MNTADYIVKRLEELGVNEFFGFPDDYNINLIDAVENNSNTKWIGCTNPLNAGYAADGYARIRGFGALITSFGTNELSAMNAIAGSMAENVPVFHIVGLPSTEKINNKTLIHHNFQNTDYKNFMNAAKSVSEAVAFITKENAKLEIDRLLTTLVRDKKPVYAAVPEDIAKTEISDRTVSYDWISDRTTLDEVASKINEKIQKSKKPVILGDVLVKRFDAGIEFREFAEKTGIPVTNFLMGTNLVNMDSPNFIGGYFGDIRNPIVKKYLDETDCLIAVGTIYSDINSFGQNLPYNINDQIAIYGNHVIIEGKRYDNVKMPEVLEAVTNLAEYKEVEFNKSNVGVKHQDAGEENLTYAYLFSKVQEFVKENDIIFAETGTSLLETAQIKLPESADFQAQALWSSTGWATPAAFGACLAKPQSRVILITGEGAHQQTAMEIGNFLRFNAKPIVIVINNKNYATEQIFTYGLDKKSNEISQVNYAKFARAFDGDIWSTKVTTAEDFDKALRVTQIMNKLCYIEACVDCSDIPLSSRELIRKLRGTINNNKLPDVNVQNVYKSIDDVVLEPSKEKCEYETIVHKTFNEDIEEETITAEEKEEQQNG